MKIIYKITYPNGKIYIGGILLCVLCASAVNYSVG
jgi:hypothetical protein